MEDSTPPFQGSYEALLHRSTSSPIRLEPAEAADELPLIDLRSFAAGRSARTRCENDIAKASAEWGFFQVVNHGISQQILESTLIQQRRVFDQPFHCKANGNILNLKSPSGGYHWGNRAATSADQFSWSEAFHIPVADISSGLAGYESLRLAAEVFAAKVAGLAEMLAEILEHKYLGVRSTFFRENCSPNSCYLRITRYPPYPRPHEVFGLIPHTDSDFLTILYQDQVGGLQLAKDGRWLRIRPNPEALIVNIGDLFEAWSNGFYKSIKHRVVANQYVERFSAAYFYCPSDNTTIASSTDWAMYRKFTFEEYRRQNKSDVQSTGNKIGLSRFLL